MKANEETRGSYTMRTTHTTSATLTADDLEILAKADAIALRYLASGPSVCSPQDAYRALQTLMQHSDEEHFAILLLDTAHNVIEYKPMFVGTIDSASVYPREVVKAALFANASSIVLAHNHPSGALVASEEDKRLTYRLTEALRYIGVDILDHIIVGRGDYISMAQLGLMK